MSDSRDRDDRVDDGPDGHGVEPAGEVERPPTPVTQQLGRVVVLVLLVIFIVFALSNAQPVDFSWLIGDTQVAEDPATGETQGGVRLIVLLLAAFVIGALSGATLLRVRDRRRARRATEGRR